MNEAQKIKRRLAKARYRANLIKRRKDIIERLGGCCVFCCSIRKLEVDHKDGRDWDINKVTLRKRIVKYEQEEKEGKLRVLCRKCNGKDGMLRKLGGYSDVEGQEKPKDNIPF
jgi:hypothetical protein